MIKQVIVVRKDLKMRRGKEIAQACHASISFLTNKLREGQLDGDFSEAELDWLSGSFTKVCLQVDSEKELMDIASAARKSHLEVHVITDAGKTEFAGVPTKTCLAIGPNDALEIDEVTGHLKLY